MSWLSASEEASTELGPGDGVARRCHLVPGCFAAKRGFDFTLVKVKILAGLLQVRNSQTIYGRNESKSLEPPTCCDGEQVSPN